MKTIIIKKKIPNPRWYQRVLFWKVYSKEVVNVPERWGEVNATQFLRLYAASLIHNDGERAFGCVRAILPTHIRDEAQLIKSSALHRIYGFMSFCEPRKVGKNGFWIDEEWKLLNNPITQSFAVKRVVLSLPGKNLEQITCKQFRDAVLTYRKIQTGQKNYIWKLICILLDTEMELKILRQHLIYPIPSLIVRYYIDSLEQIHKDIKRVSPSFFDTGKEAKGGTNINFGWDGLFLEIAKDGVFGTYEQVLASKFHDVMIYSIKKYEEALAQQRELEKINQNV